LPIDLVLVALVLNVLFQDFQRCPTSGNKSITPFPEERLPVVGV
jgi:hypothetical protein